MAVWSDKWKVTFEPISRKSKPSKLYLYLGDCMLAAQGELEMLGVTIDSKLVWSKHLTNIILYRAGQKLGALRRVANKLDVVGRATVYKPQVRSIMELCLSELEKFFSNKP